MQAGKKPPADNKVRECKSHCSGCGCHFTSDEAFDLHRRGDYATGRRCEFPEVAEHKAKDGSMVRSLEVALEGGRCELCDGPPRVGVVIWRRARSSSGSLAQRAA